MIKTIPVGVRDSFKYDPNTGAITRTVRQGNYAADTLCAAKNKCGYRTVRYAGVVWLQHRLAWYLHYGTQPPEQIDHIDLNRANNRIQNLRASTASTNQMNIPVHTRSQTGIKGIMPVRGGKLYRAEVCLHGKRYQKHSKSVAILEQWVIDKRSELHAEYARD